MPVVSPLWASSPWESRQRFIRVPQPLITGLNANTLITDYTKIQKEADCDLNKSWEQYYMYLDYELKPISPGCTCNAAWSPWGGFALAEGSCHRDSHHPLCLYLFSQQDLTERCLIQLKRVVIFISPQHLHRTRPSICLLLLWAPVKHVLIPRKTLSTAMFKYVSPGNCKRLS